MTRLDLLEKVNRLNVEAVRDGLPDKYWTVVVLYQTVIWRTTAEAPNGEMFEVVGSAENARCGCGGPCHRCAGKCSCTRCCHVSQEVDA